MPSAGVKVTGAKQLIKELAALGVDVADLKEPFNEVARRSAELAAGFAPKRTGALARSIKGSRTKNRASVAAGSKRVPYAGVQNYGWRTPGPPKRDIRAKRFMQRASDQMLPTAEIEIRKALEKLLKERHLS